MSVSLSAPERLGEVLKGARVAAKLNQVELAAAIGTDQGTVSRIERGKMVQPGRDRVSAWLTRTNASEEVQGLVAELLDRVDVDMVEWKPLEQNGWGAHQRRYTTIEKQTEQIRVYQSNLIPGLLQSPAYVRYLLGTVVRVPSSKLEEAVAARLSRNAVLYQPATHLNVVIAEHVIRTNLGGSAVMAEQLHQLAALAHLPSVDMAIVPTDTTMPETWNVAFVLMEMAEVTESRVMIELEDDELTVTEPKRVARYREMHELYRRYALAGQDAIDLVLTVAEQRDREVAAGDTPRRDAPRGGGDPGH